MSQAAAATEPEWARTDADPSDGTEEGTARSPPRSAVTLQASPSPYAEGKLGDDTQPPAAAHPPLALHTPPCGAAEGDR